MVRRGTRLRFNLHLATLAGGSIFIFIFVVCLIVALIFYFFENSWTRWRVDLPLNTKSENAKIVVKAIDEK